MLRQVLTAAFGTLVLAGSAAFALTPSEEQELAQRINAGARPQIIRLNDVMIEDYKRPLDADGTDQKVHEFLVIRSRWEEPIEFADHALAMRTLQVGGGPGANAIFVGSSGGAHCCYTAHLVWIEGRVHHQDIALADSDLKIEARGGPPRLRFSDYSFANWNAPFAMSPGPEVVLGYDPRHGEYGLDPDAMRKPAPSDSALQEIGAGIREKYEALKGDELDPGLWAAMLDLIYSGNAASARALFDTAWPEAKPGKEKFLADFTRQLWGGETWRRFELGRLLEVDPVFPRPAAAP